jgi:PhoD-like phosphatase
MNIVFTSCMDAVRFPVQAIWDEIERQQPDVFMLLGDNIYMDWGDLGEANIKASTQTAQGLLAYAMQMHAAYKAQWAIANFRRCIRDLHARNGQLFLTWDDHDFAWNNSFRQGLRDEMHSVPRRVMDVSRRLFEQFKSVLCDAGASDQYPDLSAQWAQPLAVDAAGNEQLASVSFVDHAIPVHLLDTRWYRTSRKDPALSILGINTAQSNQLLQAITEPKGLLIVAAGSPLFHAGAIGNDYWASKDRKKNYPEYDRLLLQAQRPVLYLSGDIHTNAFDGNLHLKLGDAFSATPSQVIQILASGAAIDTTPNFVVLRLAPDTPTSGRIETQLMQFKHGTWQPNTAVPTLSYLANRWQTDYHSLSTQ